MKSWAFLALSDVCSVCDCFSLHVKRNACNEPGSRRRQNYGEAVDFYGYANIVFVHSCQLLWIPA